MVRDGESRARLAVPVESMLRSLGCQGRESENVDRRGLAFDPVCGGEDDGKAPTFKAEIIWS